MISHFLKDQKIQTTLTPENMSAIYQLLEAVVFRKKVELVFN